MATGIVETTENEAVGVLFLDGRNVILSKSTNLVPGSATMLFAPRVQNRGLRRAEKTDFNTTAAA